MSENLQFSNFQPVQNYFLFFYKRFENLQFLRKVKRFLVLVKQHRVFEIKYFDFAPPPTSILILQKCCILKLSPFYWFVKIILEIYWFLYFLLLLTFTQGPTWNSPNSHPSTLLSVFYGLSIIQPTIPSKSNHSV